MEEMRIRLGTVDQIPLGQGRCFVVGIHGVAVFRSREGRLFAVENMCPHRGGPLSEGIIDETQVICPLHGHKFNLLTGQGSEAHECVKRFEVFDENRNIVLLLKPENRGVYEYSKSCAS